LPNFTDKEIEEAMQKKNPLEEFKTVGDEIKAKVERSNIRNK